MTITRIPEHNPTRAPMSQYIFLSIGRELSPKIEMKKAPAQVIAIIKFLPESR